MTQQTIDILEEPTYNTLFKKLTTTYDDHIEQLPSGASVDASRLGGPLYNTVVTPYFSQLFTHDIPALRTPQNIGELEAHMQGLDITLIDDLPESLISKFGQLRKNVTSDYGPGLISERARIESKHPTSPLVRMVSNYRNHVLASAQPVTALFVIDREDRDVVEGLLGTYELDHVA